MPTTIHAFVLAFVVYFTDYTYSSTTEAERQQDGESHEGGPDLEAGLPQGNIDPEARATPQEDQQDEESHEGDSNLETGLPEGNIDPEARATPQEGQEQDQVASTSSVHPDPSAASVRAAILSFGTLTGSAAIDISVGEIVAIFTGLDRAQTLNLGEELLLAACVLSLFASFISGGTLLLFPLIHIRNFQQDDLQSIQMIQYITVIAIVSMALVMICVAVLIGLWKWF